MATPWVYLTDEATGYSYYANTETKETCWEAPAELGGPDADAGPGAALPPEVARERRAGGSLCSASGSVAGGGSRSRSDAVRLGSGCELVRTGGSRRVEHAE